MNKLPGFTAEASLGRNGSYYTPESFMLRAVLSAYPQIVGQQLRAPGGTIDPGRLPEDVGIFLPGYGECEEPGCDICGGNIMEGDGVPVYGNWCGPGHGGDPNTPAIDAVDAVCKVHDLCYSERGYLDCSCDRELLERMPAAIADTRTSAQGKACGALISQTFSLTPCLCWTQVCVPVPTFCTESVPYPCGVKWCKKWGIPYPCGVKWCTETISYPCGVETRCADVPLGAGAGGVCHTPGVGVAGRLSNGR